jgi:hypothetical protein
VLALPVLLVLADARAPPYAVVVVGLLGLTNLVYQVTIRRLTW